MWSHCMNASSAQTEIAPSESKQHISFIKKEKKIARVRLLPNSSTKEIKRNATNTPRATVQIHEMEIYTNPGKYEATRMKV